MNGTQKTRVYPTYQQKEGTKNSKCAETRNWYAEQEQDTQEKCGKTLYTWQTEQANFL